MAHLAREKDNKIQNTKVRRQLDEAFWRLRNKINYYERCKGAVIRKRKEKIKKRKLINIMPFAFLILGNNDNKNSMVSSDINKEKKSKNQGLLRRRN